MVEFKDVSVTYSSGVDALSSVNLKINDKIVASSSAKSKSEAEKLCAEIALKNLNN